MPQPRLENFTAAVSVVRGQLNALFATHNLNGQAPLDFIVTGQLRDYPPVAFANIQNCLTALIEAAFDRGPPVNRWRTRREEHCLLVVETRDGIGVARVIAAEPRLVDGLERRHVFRRICRR